MGTTASSGRVAGSAETHSRRARSTTELAGRYATLIAFVAMVGVFWAQFPDTFGTWENFRSILQLAAPLLILAIGLTVVLLVGEFDLSFPGIVGIATLATVKVMADGDGSTLLAVLIGVGVGVAAGLIAGVLVVTERASSFIVTLALSTIWGGAALGVSEGKFITDVNESFSAISLKTILLPVPIWLALAVMLLGYGLLKWTVFGREVQAVGSNKGAARLAGVPVKLRVVGAWAFLGLCAGIAAVLLASSSAAYTPDVGAELFLPPFVAAFFGISVLAVGRFNVFGTVVGALFIQTLQTGLIFNGVSAWVSNVAIGATLLVILMIAGQVRQR